MVTADVAALLTRFFDQYEARAQHQGVAFRLLWNNVRKATEGGKQLRPELVVTAHRELGGTHDADVVSLAAAQELLHTAFLVHDDVIDGDTIRRGKHNLIGTFEAAAISQGIESQAARTWAHAAGILAGDLLINAAQGMIARLPIANDTRNRLLDLFDTTIAITAAGELQDVGLTEGIESPDLDGVLSMTRCKTAYYSFQAPLEAGAILADADQEIIKNLNAYGLEVGTAFQLRDDLLGVFGETERTGKSTTSDLCRATMTPLVAFALQTPYKADLLQSIGPSVVDNDAAERARTLLIECGAQSYVMQEIDQRVQRATELAQSSNISSEFSEYLVALAVSVKERTK